ncbi:MAG: PilZ domain-containing protein [Phycisphaerae bacterium]
MTLTAVDRQAPTRILEADASARVLQTAAMANNPITLCADEDSPDDSMLGIIVGGNESQLEVEISSLDHRAHTILGSPVLYASMDVSDNRYVFRTQCVTASLEDDTHILRLVRPAAIALVERRRSRRRALRGNTQMTLRSDDPDAGWRIQADVLNLSLNGVAGRTCESHAAGVLDIGQIIRVAFTLGAPAAAFDLTARVVSWTPAATRGNVVLGIEFVDDDRLDACRNRLRAALARPE